MADNFLQFGATIRKLSKEEKGWAEAHLELFGGGVPQEGEFGYDEFTHLIGVYELEDDEDTLGFDWVFRNDGGLWIYAELNGNPDHVASFVQMFLQKFRPDEAFSMSWATTTAPLYLNELGGGAIFVSANKIQKMNAWAWCQARWNEFRGSK